MITFSIIQKSQLEGAKRLDAEYYQPEYLAVKEKTIFGPHWVLGDHAFIADGEHGSVEFYSNGIKYLTAENVQEGFLNLEGIRFVSEAVDKRNRRASLEEGDVVLSIKGTVGQAAIVNKSDLPANMNRDVARIHLKNSIDPYFLVAFLNSKFGRGQTERESSGNVQQMITLSRIRELVIPKINDDKQKIIREIYQKSYVELENSKSLYAQAEKLFLEEIGIKRPIDNYAKLFSVVNFSEIKKAGRMDAEYYQPKYQQVLSIIRENDGRALGQLATIKKGIEPGAEAYQEEGKLFIRVSSVSRDGITDKDQKYLKEDLYEKLKKNYQPQAGEILLTKDASPGIAYVIKEPVEGVISGGVLRVKLKEGIEPEYLAMVINSLIGQSQVERDAGGSIIAHWKPEQVKELQIPILSQKIQQKIAVLVQDAHLARQKAKALLAEAKRTVEELIEGK